jgi:1,4-alpha-glucan branching enzyme
VDVAVTGARPIIFELDAPTAGSVQVLGDFNGWSRDADRMQRNADGRWRLTTMLPPGRYVYAYLIDGRQFVRDPMREPVEDRDFGVTGSELVIGEAP